MSKGIQKKVQTTIQSKPVRTGVRAKQRSERRERLVKAAARLLNASSGNGSGFSMIELAEAAGFSQATPYNLFGSKAAILQAVFAREVRSFHGAAIGSERVDPIVQLHGIAKVLAREFSRRPNFYRGLTQSLREAGLEGSHDLFIPVQSTLFTPLTNAFRQENGLVDWLAENRIHSHLGYVLSGKITDWLHRSWQRDELEKELFVGLAFGLIGCVVDPLRTRLEKAVQDALA